MAEDALYIMTSGIHGALTPPSRPWFRLTWADDKIDKVEPLAAWLQECERLLQEELHKSNFYTSIDNCYIEHGGFGVTCMFVGALDAISDAAFHFESLTVGEYAYSFGEVGVVNTFFRTLYLSPRQIVEQFPKNAPSDLRAKVKNKDSGIDTVDQVILEVVLKEKHADFNYRRYFFWLQDQERSDDKREDEAFHTDSFYEHPYAVGRWTTVSRDAYALGPGVRAVPDVRRLQEVEKSVLMAAHKMVDPPVNVPARMRGKLSTLPGAKNYSASPNEKVEPVYTMQFDLSSAGVVLERIEGRIQKCFYNDVFLTGSRDPNASPYKATEVTAREQERMLRLGPVVERLQHEFLRPIIERCFNIMLRAGKFPPLSAELQEMAGEYKITLVSPLATAQRQVALQGINSFLAFLGQAAQFNQSILDNIDVDEAARDYADITGVRYGILRTKDEVKQIRQGRQKAMQAERERQDQMQREAMTSELDSQRAATQKTQADAGLTLIEGQQKATEAGIL
jgi:hypothetical protein